MVQRFPSSEVDKIEGAFIISMITLDTTIRALRISVLHTRKIAGAFIFFLASPNWPVATIFA